MKNFKIIEVLVDKLGVGVGVSFKIIEVLVDKLGVGVGVSCVVVDVGFVFNDY